MIIERDELIAEGHQLMRGSNEVRANDIQYNISILKNQWQKLQDLHASRSVVFHHYGVQIALLSKMKISNFVLIFSSNHRAR